MRGQGGNVPKVTWGWEWHEAYIKEKREAWQWALLPASCGADEAIGNGAKPEVDDQAPIQLEGVVAGQVEERAEEEVGDVTEDDCTEGLEEVDEHIRFDTGSICRVARALLMRKVTLPSRSPC